jgi:hypothetical protein
MSNFQRSGALSNAYIGREFEDIIREYFRSTGIIVDYGIGIPIGLKYKKEKKYDLGSQKERILIECKAHTWTKPNDNSPSAKISTWISEMYKFLLCPHEYRKIFVVQYDYSTKHNETLLQYFIRLNRHLIPDDVELMEYDIDNNTMYQRKT